MAKDFIEMDEAARIVVSVNPKIVWMHLDAYSEDTKSGWGLRIWARPLITRRRWDSNEIHTENPSPFPSIAMWREQFNSKPIRFNMQLVPYMEKSDDFVEVAFRAVGRGDLLWDKCFDTIITERNERLLNHYLKVMEEKAKKVRFRLRVEQNQRLRQREYWKKLIERDERKKARKLQRLRNSKITSTPSVFLMAGAAEQLATAQQ